MKSHLAGCCYFETLYSTFILGTAPAAVPPRPLYIDWLIDLSHAQWCQKLWARDFSTSGVPTTWWWCFFRCSQGRSWHWSYCRHNRGSPCDRWSEGSRGDGRQRRVYYVRLRRARRTNVHTRKQAPAFTRRVNQQYCIDFCNKNARVFSSCRPHTAAGSRRGYRYIYCCCGASIFNIDSTYPRAGTRRLTIWTGRMCDQQSQRCVLPVSTCEKQRMRKETLYV